MPACGCRTKFGLRVRANLSLTLVVVNQAINLLPHWANWSTTYSVVNYFNDSTNDYATPKICPNVYRIMTINLRKDNGS